MGLTQITALSVHLLKNDLYHKRSQLAMLANRSSKFYAGTMTKHSTKRAEIFLQDVQYLLWSKNFLKVSIGREWMLASARPSLFDFLIRLISSWVQASSFSIPFPSSRKPRIQIMSSDSINFWIFSRMYIFQIKLLLKIRQQLWTWGFEKQVKGTNSILLFDYLIVS